MSRLTTVTLFLVAFSQIAMAESLKSEECFLSDRNAITKFICDDKDLVIPSVVDGYEIIGIAEYSFSSLDLTTVQIPEGIRNIGYAAFAGNKLKVIDFPDSIRWINIGAFANNELTYLKLPNALKSVNEHSFEQNHISTIDFPKSITDIGSFAFAHNQISNLVLPENLTGIGQCAFMDNPLTSIHIGEGVEIWSCYSQNSPFTLFEKVYVSGGRQAGDYIWNGSNWLRSH